MCTSVALNQERVMAFWIEVKIQEIAFRALCFSLISSPCSADT